MSVFGRGVVTGIAIALLCAAFIAFAAVEWGWVSARADSKPSKLETWAAKTSLRASIGREADKSAANPVPLNDAGLAAGIKLYGQHCAVCHGAADGKASAIAQGLYIDAPQLATDGVEDDPPAVTFWKLKHGIRFTGMPSFSPALSDEQLWQLTLFLEHMDKLPPGPKAQWEKLPSAAAPG